MEYEKIPFLGMFSYGVSVKRPIEHRSIAVVDFSSTAAMPNLYQLREITAYLCGAGMRRHIYHLHGHSEEIAASISRDTKDFAIWQKYVGVNIPKIPDLGDVLAECKERVRRNSAPSIEKAIEDLLAEQEASGLPL